MLVSEFHSKICLKEIDIPTSILFIYKYFIKRYIPNWIQLSSRMWPIQHPNEWGPQNKQQTKT